MNRKKLKKRKKKEKILPFTLVVLYSAVVWSIGSLKRKESKGLLWCILFFANLHAINLLTEDSTLDLTFY